MVVGNEELGFYDFTVKFIEKGVVTLQKIRNGTDLTDEDEALLKVLHDCVWFEGTLPLYKTKTAINDEKVVQGGLFDLTIKGDTVYDDMAL